MNEEFLHDSCELIWIVILAAYFGLRFARRSVASPNVAQMVFLFGVSWAAEQSAIQVYRVYSYSAAIWSSWIGSVPVLVPLIWVVVLDSATALASIRFPHQSPDCVRGKRTLFAVAVVLIDAAIIEPLSVAAGFWQWTLPGPLTHQSSAYSVGLCSPAQQPGGSVVATFLGKTFFGLVS